MIAFVDYTPPPAIVRSVEMPGKQMMGKGIGMMKKAKPDAMIMPGTMTRSTSVAKAPSVGARPPVVRTKTTTAPMPAVPAKRPTPPSPKGKKPIMTPGGDFRTPPMAAPKMAMKKKR